MVSKKIKIFGIIVVALLAIGFCFSSDEYTEDVYVVYLRKGETVEGVSEAYYDKNEDGACYDAFRYRVLKRNQHLFENGRIPQINDLVVVPVKIKK